MSESVIADGDAAMVEPSTSGIGALVAALCRARKNFGAVEKDKTAVVFKKGTNVKLYEYSYLSLESVIAATSESLANEGIVIFQRFDNSQSGKITVITELVHSSGAMKTNCLTLPCGGDPQSIGSAITYARRYSYLALLNLSPADDDDDGARAKAAAEAAARDRQGSQSRPPQQANGDGDLLNQTTARVKREMRAGNRGRAWDAIGRLCKESRGELPVSVRDLEEIAARLDGWTVERVREEIQQAMQTEATKLPAVLLRPIGTLLYLMGPPREQKPGEPAGKLVGKTAPVEPVDGDPWNEVWGAVHREVNKVEASAPRVGRQGSINILQVLSEDGWDQKNAAEVIAGRIGRKLSELPQKDTGGRPIERWIVKAFKAREKSENSSTKEEIISRLCSAGGFPGDDMRQAWVELNTAREDLVRIGEGRPRISESVGLESLCGDEDPEAIDWIPQRLFGFSAASFPAALAPFIAEVAKAFPPPKMPLPNDKVELLRSFAEWAWSQEVLTLTDEPKNLKKPEILNALFSFETV